MSKPIKRYTITCQVIEVDEEGFEIDVEELGGLRWATTDRQGLINAFCELFDDAENRVRLNVPKETLTWLRNPDELVMEDELELDLFDGEESKSSA